MRLIITLSLFAFWLVLSGHYEVWLIAFGIGCAIAVALFSGHMGIADREGHPVALLPRALIYWGWLAKEMVVSALHVARLILDPEISGRIISLRLLRKKPNRRVTVHNVDRTVGRVIIDHDDLIAIFGVVLIQQGVDTLLKVFFRVENRDDY